MTCICIFTSHWYYRANWWSRWFLWWSVGRTGKLDFYYPRWKRISSL